MTPVKVDKNNENKTGEYDKCQKNLIFAGDARSGLPFRHQSATQSSPSLCLTHVGFLFRESSHQGNRNCTLVFLYSRHNMSMEYNTSRPRLAVKEYGRHIQKMTSHLKTLPDKQQRQQCAESIVHTMLLLNPQLRNVEEYSQKLWNHLHVIADFDLNVDCPFPTPSREDFVARPECMPYPRRYPRFVHLGKNIELLIEVAINETDPEKKDIYTHIIIQAMRQIYQNKHYESPSDDELRDELAKISRGALLFVPNSAYTCYTQPNLPRNNRHKFSAASREHKKNTKRPTYSPAGSPAHGRSGKHFSR